SCCDPFGGIRGTASVPVRRARPGTVGDLRPGREDSRGPREVGAGRRGVVEPRRQSCPVAQGDRLHRRTGTTPGRRSSRVHLLVARRRERCQADGLILIYTLDEAVAFHVATSGLACGPLTSPQARPLVATIGHKLRERV